MRFRVTSILLLFVMLAPAWALAQTPASAPLARALEALRARPGAAGVAALAAEASAEGHWTFANLAGEQFTVGTPEELKRVVPTLAPDAAKPGVRLALAVTEDSVLRYRQHFLALALASDWRTDAFLVRNRELQALLRRGERGREQLYAEMMPNVYVELGDRRLLDEATWLLMHPLRRSAVRVLAVETGRPESVPVAPRLDPQTKRALTDRIGPAGLESALRTLARQTVILTARRDGDVLSFQPSSGPEHTRSFKEVLAAAEAADVNLVLLNSAHPGQPGARSWWWGSVSVKRLDDALGRDHLVDFLNAIASPQGKLLVSLREDGLGRVRLLARPLKDESSPRTGIGDALSEFASNIVGQVVVSGVEASLRDRGRQSELDMRVLPGLPSVVQWIYAALVLLGLAGHRVARVWWSRIWPVERRDSYAGTFGYVAASAVRGFFYLVVFMPLVAMASAPAALRRRMKREPAVVPATVE